MSRLSHRILTFQQAVKLSSSWKLNGSHLIEITKAGFNIFHLDSLPDDIKRLAKNDQGLFMNPTAFKQSDPKRFIRLFSSIRASKHWSSLSFEQLNEATFMVQDTITLEDEIPVHQAALIISQRSLIEPLDKSTKMWYVINAGDNEEAVKNLKNCIFNRSPMQWCLIANKQAMDPRILARLIDFNQSDLAKGEIHLHNKKLDHDPKIIERMQRLIQWTSPSYYSAALDAAHVSAQAWLNDHQTKYNKDPSYSVSNFNAYNISLDHMHLSLSISHLIFLCCSLQHCHFSNSTWNNITFSKAKLAESRFIYANTKHNKFYHCDLVNTQWRNSELVASLFYDSSLDNSKITDSSLIACAYQHTTLRQTHWSDVSIHNSTWDTCDLQNTRWKRIEFQHQCVIKDSTLSDSIFEDCDLRQLVFKGQCKAKNLTLSGTIILTAVQKQRFERSNVKMETASLIIRPIDDTITLDELLSRNQNSVNSMIRPASHQTNRRQFSLFRWGFSNHTDSGYSTRDTSAVGSAETSERQAPKRRMIFRRG